MQFDPIARRMLEANLLGGLGLDIQDIGDCLWSKAFRRCMACRLARSGTVEIARLFAFTTWTTGRSKTLRLAGASDIFLREAFALIFGMLRSRRHNAQDRAKIRSPNMDRGPSDSQKLVWAYSSLVPWNLEKWIRSRDPAGTSPASIQGAQRQPSLAWKQVGLQWADEHADLVSCSPVLIHDETWLTGACPAKNMSQR